jgi:hypothetical protein
MGGYASRNPHTGAWPAREHGHTPHSQHAAGPLGHTPTRRRTVAKAEAYVLMSRSRKRSRVRTETINRSAAIRSGSRPAGLGARGATCFWRKESLRGRASHVLFVPDIAQQVPRSTELNPAVPGGS